MPSEAEQIRHSSRNPIQCLRHQYNQLTTAIRAASDALISMQRQIARIELALSPEDYIASIRPDSRELNGDEEAKP